MKPTSRRVIADLKELAALTSDERGAQRVAWGPVWRTARDWFTAKVRAELGVEVRRDPAGNLWATLPGRSRRGLIVGSHLDSVPGGGWLDGCLGVLAGLDWAAFLGMAEDLALIDGRAKTLAAQRQKLFSVAHRLLLHAITSLVYIQQEL